MEQDRRCFNSNAEKSFKPETQALIRDSDKCLCIPPDYLITVKMVTFTYSTIRMSRSSGQAPGR